MPAIRGPLTSECCITLEPVRGRMVGTVPMSGDDVIVPAEPFAVVSQHLQLVGQVRAVEDVACVGYCATSRSVFRSPAPPMRTGGWGRLRAWGEFSVRSSR